MKYFSSVLLLIATLLLTPLYTWPNQGELIILLRDHESEDAVDSCRSLKREYSLANCEILQSESFEFGNGNTFVRFLTQVTNRDVKILIDHDLSANELMETLIKIRTARTLGARSIIVLSAGTRIDDFTLYLMKLAGAQDFNVYGGNGLWVRHSENSLYSQSKGLNPTVNEGTYKSVVYSEEGFPLGQGIAEKLEIPFTHDFDEVKEEKVLKRVFFAMPMSPSANRTIFDSLRKIRDLVQNGHKVLLLTPYLPYSRSDKIDQEGTTVTGKLIADLIEGMGTHAAAFARLHAPQVQGFFRIPTFHISGRETITKRLKELEIDAIVSPDAGFQKEATLYADLLGVPVFVLNKQRDPITGESRIVQMGSFDFDGLKLAVIDDETASGSTLGGTAEFLKSQGASVVYGVVTHLAGNAQKATSNRYLNKLIITDSIPSESNGDRIEMLSLASEFSEILKRLLKDPCGSALTKI